MPYAGFKSFLLSELRFLLGVLLGMCQCPMRALSHFYDSVRRHRHTGRFRRVNALCGL